MTTYNTGNPVPSADFKDLHDNAEFTDEVASSMDATALDRFGRTRPTWAGTVAYAVIGEAYGAGIEFTGYNQIILDGGEYWRVSASQALPYTTTGAGMPEGGAFVSVGDAVLRQDLADQSDPAKGAAIVGYNGSTVAAFLNDIQFGGDASKGPALIPYADLQYTAGSLGEAVSQALRTSGDLAIPTAILPFFPHRVSLLPDGRGAVDWDIDDYRPSGKTYYVSPTGSDSNSGLTPAAPLISISAALNKSDVDVIVLEPGSYPRNIGCWGYKSITRNILMTVSGTGVADIYGSDDEGAQSWTVNGTYSNVYQRNRSSVTSVYDSAIVDERGDFTRYPLVASIADVSTTPGSYYTDGTTVYVRLLDDRAPDTDLRVNLNIICSVNGSGTLFLDRVNFYGTTFLARSNTGTLVRPTVYAKRCRFGYGHFDGLLGSGSFMSEGAITYLQECEAFRSKRDGFNYHPNSAGEFTPFSFELDCIGRDNGLSGEDNDNGSTSHSGGVVLRVNCRGERNFGPNIIDVGAGTVSYNVGCRAKTTNMLSEPRNYETQGRPEGVSDMYLVSCTSEGRREFDARVRDQAGYEGNLWYYNTNLDENTGAVSFIQKFYPFA